VTVKGDKPVRRSVRWVRKRPRLSGIFCGPVSEPWNSRSPTTQLIRGRRTTSAREIAPLRRRCRIATETIDAAIVGKLAELGVMAAALPEEHGGMGLDMVSYTLVVEELGKADSNVRGIVSVSNGLYGKSLAKWENRGAKARLLRLSPPVRPSAVDL